VHAYVAWSKPICVHRVVFDWNGVEAEAEAEGEGGKGKVR